MDVKDVQPRNAPVSSENGKVSDRGSRQRSINSLKSGSARPVNIEPVKVNVSETPRSRNDARVEVNEAINFSNVAGEASSKLSVLVESVSGIVQQVSDPDVPKERIPVLEREAKEIVKEIKRATKDVATLSPPKSSETSSSIRKEIDEAFGETLKRLLPEDVDSALGLDDINFSTAENILSVRASVQKARARVEDLRGSLDGATSQIRSAAATLEVAIQNGEAAESTIRDVEEALSVVSQTSERISQDPERALNSVGPFAPKARELLK